MSALTMLTNGNKAHYDSEEMKQQIKYYLDTLHLWGLYALLFLWEGLLCSGYPYPEMSPGKYPRLLQDSGTIVIQK